MVKEKKKGKSNEATVETITDRTNPSNYSWNIVAYIEFSNVYSVSRQTNVTYTGRPDLSRFAGIARDDPFLDESREG